MFSSSDFPRFFSETQKHEAKPPRLDEHVPPENPQPSQEHKAAKSGATLPLHAASFLQEEEVARAAQARKLQPSRDQRTYTLED